MPVQGAQVIGKYWEEWSRLERFDIINYYDEHDRSRFRFLNKTLC